MFDRKRDDTLPFCFHFPHRTERGAKLKKMIVCRSHREARSHKKACPACILDSSMDSSGKDGDYVWIRRWKGKLRQLSSSLSIFLNATHSSSWAECSRRCLLSRRPLLKYCADFERRLLSFSNGAKLVESFRSSLTEAVHRLRENN